MKNSLRDMLALGLALAALGVLSSCGYTLVGSGNYLPPTIKTIQIPTFVNKTTRVELEQRVTQAVADEMVSRSGRHLVANEKDADAILEGTIESFGITPIAFNDQGRATRYQATVIAKIALVDHRHDDKVIWKNDHYNFTANYAVDISSGDSFDQETRAIQEIAQQFAESVVSSLLEGF